jgi:hypothetical protein
MASPRVTMAARSADGPPTPSVLAVLAVLAALAVPPVLRLMAAAVRPLVPLYPANAAVVDLAGTQADGLTMNRAGAQPGAVKVT